MLNNNVTDVINRNRRLMNSLPALGHEVDITTINYCEKFYLHIVFTSAHFLH